MALDRPEGHVQQARDLGVGHPLEDVLEPGGSAEIVFVLEIGDDDNYTGLLSFNKASVAAPTAFQAPEDSRATRGLTVTTFHSLCARLLRRYAEIAQLPGLKPDFTIYDSGDQTAMMKNHLYNNQKKEREDDGQRRHVFQDQEMSSTIPFLSNKTN